MATTSADYNFRELEPHWQAAWEAAALSRADNATEICSACGNHEAVQDWTEGGCTPVESWPVEVLL